MIRRIFIFPLSLILILFASFAHAENFSFTPQDHILIVAPHPDDETLGTGGIIQSALKAGAEVKVIYLTHGESNEISALFYQKRPMITKTDFVKIGRLRKQEAVEAMALLGVPEKNLIFFGYPDMGTMPIWERFWSSVKPFRSFFTRINKVIHESDFSFGKYYRGYNIIHDFEKVLLDSKPTHIFVTAPFDLNLDHQAAYLFLQTALLNIDDDAAARPAVHLYLIHEHDWPKPRKYLPGERLDFPVSPTNPGVRWTPYELSSEEAAKKKESLLCYDSQLSYSKNFLLSFVRTNEIYAKYPLETVEIQRGISAEDWALGAGRLSSNDVQYAVSGRELWVQIPLVYALDEMGTFSTNVFGYKKGIPFTEMPKLKFRLLGNNLFIKDGLKPFSDEGIFFKIDKSRLFLRIPLKVLKDPDYLFVSTRTAKNRLAFDFGSWRVLQIEKNTK